MQYLCREPFTFWDIITTTAAEYEHVDVLEWIHTERSAQYLRIAMGTILCNVAAQVGRLDVLQFARAIGCPWNTSTCEYAAEGGHLELLRWARANDCPWNLYTCVLAAKGGHLEVLQSVRANGCQWNTFTYLRAA